MDTTAYDKNLPCLNPHCKSHGKPHPNCRCYGMAEGGEVSHFCQSGKSHNANCEYYMEGGGVVGQERPQVSFKDMQDEGQPIEQASTDFSSMKDEGPPKQETPKSFADMKDEGPPSFKDMQDEGPPPDGAPEVSPWQIAKDALTAGKTLIAGNLNEKPDIAPQSKVFLENVVPMGKTLSKSLGWDTNEGIAQGEKDYPDTALAGKTAQAIGTIAAFGAGKSLMTNTLAQIGQVTTDDLDNYLIGKGPQNPTDAVGAWMMDVGITTATSLVAGVALPVLGKVGGRVSNELIEKGNKFLINLGVGPLSEKKIGAALAVSLLGKAGYDYRAGHYKDLGKDMLEEVGIGIATALAEKPTKAINWALGRIGAYALSKGNTVALPAGYEWGRSLYNGLSKLEPLVESAIRGVATELVPWATEKQKKYFKKNVEEGYPTKQLSNEMHEMPGMAKGGMVESKPGQEDHVSQLYPEFGMAMGIAKGRIYNYMNSIRPGNDNSKLPYDQHPPNKQKEKDYNNAIEIAINPLSVMNKLNKGTLTPTDMKHLSNLHPEAYSLMAKKITKGIMQSQLKGEKPPPYSRRQGLSLFLGANLETTFTPLAIATIQGIYQMNKSQQQQPGVQKPKKSTSPLSKLAPSAMTDDQARTQREQNQRS